MKRLSNERLRSIRDSVKRSRTREEESQKKVQEIKEHLLSKRSEYVTHIMENEWKTGDPKDNLFVLCSMVSEWNEYCREEVKEKRYPKEVLKDVLFGQDSEETALSYIQQHERGQQIEGLKEELSQLRKFQDNTREENDNLLKSVRQIHNKPRKMGLPSGEEYYRLKSLSKGNK